MSTLAHNRIFLSLLLLVLQWSVAPKFGACAALAADCCCSARAGAEVGKVTGSDEAATRPTCCHPGLPTEGDAVDPDGGDLEGWDLEGWDLEGWDLEGWDLEGWDLAGGDPEDPHCPCFSVDDLLLSQDHAAQAHGPSNPHAPGSQPVALAPSLEVEARSPRGVPDRAAIPGNGRRLHLLHQVFLI